jgi:hypothetical protein
MKRKTITWVLILLLVLGALSGCKQSDNIKTAQENSKQYHDYFVCQYQLQLKDEFANRTYALDDFGDVDATELQSFANPTVYYLHTTYTDKQKVFNVFQTLWERKDVENMRLLYTVYQVEKSETNPSLPSLERSYLADESISDGVIEVIMEYDGFTINNIITPSFFSDIPIEAIRAVCTEHSVSSSIFLKVRGIEALNEVIEKVKTYDHVTTVRLCKNSPETIA